MKIALFLVSLLLVAFGGSAVYRWVQIDATMRQEAMNCVNTANPQSANCRTPVTTAVANAAFLAGAPVVAASSASAAASN